MTNGVVHRTAADSTFSTQGSGEWNKAHDINETGGATLGIGSIADGQFLKRVGTSITSAAGTSVSTPTFPGGIALTGVKYPRAANVAVNTGDTDLYTVPTGKRAMFAGIALFNASGIGAITWYPQVKVSSTYYRFLATISTNNGVQAQTTVGYIAEAGEIISINTATNNGAIVIPQLIEFDNTCSVYAAKLTSLSAGDNTLYTVPASTTATLLTVVALQAMPVVNQATIRYVNSSGGARTIIPKIQLNGGAVTQCAASQAPSDLTTVTFIVPGMYSAGDAIIVNTDAATATQFAYVNVMEVT